jgi:hypothetical protein
MVSVMLINWGFFTAANKKIGKATNITLPKKSRIVAGPVKLPFAPVSTAKLGNME